MAEHRPLADVHAAVKHYVNAIPYKQILSTATHISTDIDFHPVTDAEMEAALKRRAQAGPAERESRTERLYRAYEANKPYLVSRWRWPDRFNP